MGDGRDGLPEVVHLFAEKKRLADEVTKLRYNLNLLANYPPLVEHGVRQWELEVLGMRKLAKELL